MSQLVLLWEANGKLHEYPLKPGTTYYIGRPRTKHLLKHPWMKPEGVYIIPENTREKPVYTGHDTLLVSRLDTKITISYTGDTVEIENHGPQGHGARNPTFINGRRLPPGEKIRLRLNDGQTATIELTSMGPSFTLAARKNNKTILNIEPDLPTVIPKTIAKELENKGLVKEVAELREDSLIVAKEGKIKIKDYIIIIKPQENQENKKEKSYQQLKDLLNEAYRQINKHTEEAKIILAKIKLEHYKKLLRELDEEAYAIYQQLIILLQHEDPETNKQKILDLIDKLIQIINNKPR